MTRARYISRVVTGIGTQVIRTTLGEGWYTIYAASLESQAQYAARGSIYFRPRKSDGTYLNIKLASGFSRIGHQIIPKVLPLWILGPGELNSVMHHLASHEHAFTALIEPGRHFVNV